MPQLTYLRADGTAMALTTAPRATEERPQDKPPVETPKTNQFRNSPVAIAAMVLGALLFAGLCIYIATSGGSDASDTNVASGPIADAPVVDEPAVAEQEPVVDEPAVAEQEPVVDEPAVAEPERAADEPLAAAEPVAEQPAPVEEPEPAPVAEPAAEDNAAAFESPPPPPGAPERYSIMHQGRLFMRGTIPSEEIEAQIVVAVEAVLGPGNAISEYVIDPDVPFDRTDPAPVFNTSQILFETGSAEIGEQFYPIIAPTPILLAIQPNVVVTIFGHTDSVGSEETNLALSQARVDAVRDWVIAQGGDADRLIAIGVGEAEPVADNSTEEGRAANRRVEFVLDGFEF